MTRMLRIAYISHDLSFSGGAQNSLFQIASGLKQRGEIEAQAFSPFDGPMREAYGQAGIPVEIVGNPARGATLPAQIETASAPLRASLQAFQPDIVHANVYFTYWAVHAAHAIGAKTIFNLRDSYEPDSLYNHLPSPISAWAYEALHLADRVVFVSHATRDLWTGRLPAEKLSAIHNGLDLGRIDPSYQRTNRDRVRGALGAGPGDVVIILVGTILERKGQLDAVRALKRLDAGLASRIRVVMLGAEGYDYEYDIAAKIRQLPQQLRSRVTMLAPQRDVVPFLKAADIFLCASRSESYPRSVLEAMACSLPIISTPVFGVREQVAEGINGLFFEPGNIAELTRHISRLAGDTDYRAKLAANSRPVFDALTSYSGMLDAYLSTYRNLLAG